jgi:ribosomal protein S18 acetylase RimI-like enzyme
VRGMALSIRPAEPRDARALATVTVDGWRAGYRGIVPDESLAQLSVDDRTERWREFLAKDESFTLVAEVEGEVAGLCGVARPSRDEDAGPHTAEIVALYVAPARWRAGIGSALVDRWLEQLEREGWADVTLWVFAANAGGRAFYARHGFELADETRNEYYDLPVVRLRRRLNP